jgi:hypothetical protein
MATERTRRRRVYVALVAIVIVAFLSLGSAMVTAVMYPRRVDEGRRAQPIVREAAP